MTRDRVSHHSHILADTHVPSESPEVLLLDSLPFHVGARTPGRRPEVGW